LSALNEVSVKIFGGKAHFTGGLFVVGRSECGLNV
jgi:hypothetical protein